MRAMWLTLALVACGGRAPEPLPTVPTRVPARGAEAPRTLDWRDLAITGENWFEKVETIPQDQRVAMALDLIEGGGFACQTVASEGCEQGQLMPVPGIDDDIDEPCLRRLLALWAVDQLSDEDIYERFDLMTSLVWVPPPEEALTLAVLERFQTGFEAATIRWEAEAAGHKYLPEFDFAGALDPDEVKKAATELHLDDALLALDPIEDADVYIAALDDRELRPETHLEVMDRLLVQRDRFDEPTRRQVAENLGWLRYSSDCALAAAAIATGAQFEGTDLEMPQGPFDTEQALIAAACASLAMDIRGAQWKQVVTKHGLAVKNDREYEFRVDSLWTKYPFAFDNDMDGVPDVPEADPDHDGNASNVVETSTRWVGQRFTLPFADELELALPHCDGRRCKVPDSSVWFELDIRQERGTWLRLRGIERHERVGFDC